MSDTQFIVLAALLFGVMGEVAGLNRDARGRAVVCSLVATFLFAWVAVEWLVSR